MSDFNLNDLIATVRETVGPNPHDIAVRVEPLIPESERCDVLLMLLTRYIVSVKPRLTQVMNPPPAAGTTTPPIIRSPQGAAARSAKVAAYREYGRLLKLTVKVSATERKYMEDCTYADLTFAAQIRRENSVRNEAAAAQYEELAALLKKHKAATVGKLAPAVLGEFVNRDRSAA